ncbi:MAG: peptidylprolyl isomerase [Planctomycetota bacterium]
MTHLRPYALPALALAASAAAAPLAQAQSTVVRFTTNAIPAGETEPVFFDIQLFGNEAPLHEQNFLSYVNDGRYDDQIIHRLIPGFVVQGGGFTFPTPAGQTAGANMRQIDTDPQVPSENPNGLSNTRGFVALAQSNFPGTSTSNPDSGDSQWFINYGDNSSLDAPANGSFTVFGRVVRGTMDVVDSLAGLGTGDFTLGVETPEGAVFGQPFQNVPFFPGGGFLFISDAAIVDPIAASDFNGDGVVDLLDFDTLAFAFGGPGTAVSGDANGDADVDLLDFDALAFEFGDSSLPPAAVPEPASAALLGLAALALTRRRRA